MTSKKIRSPEWANKPRPKPKKIPGLVKGSKENRSTTVTGYVTALRSDGTVNLRVDGNRFRGVPTLATYDIRSVGDKVSVLKSGPKFIVLGKVGSDDLTVTPEIYPSNYVQWTWGIANGLGDKRLYIEAPGSDVRVGRKSEQFPVNNSDYMARVGINYYTGTEPNLMNGPADTTKQIDFYAERSEWDDGYDGPASYTLFGITNTGYFPNDPRPGSLLYQVALTTPSIDFTLEPGELKIITLPDDWRDNIGAATLDANTIRGFVIEPAGGSISVTNVNMRTYGLLTPLTGALKIYNFA